MPKIAFYISSLRRGGSERVMVNLADGFLKCGYRVVIVTTFKRPGEPEYPLSPDIKRIISEPVELKKDSGINARIYNFRIRVRTLRKIWLSEKPDIIVSFIGKNNMMAILSAEKTGIPVICSVRGNPPNEYPSFSARTAAGILFAKASGVVLQTKKSGDFFPERVRRRSVILPNPLNPDFMREPYTGIREKTVVSVGTLDPNKNQAMLINAFDKAANDHPEWKLIIYGEGAARKKLEALLAEKVNADRICLYGECDDICSAIDDAGIFVLSSDTEGSPNALIEAMAQGLACISTDCPCGGPAELIEHGKNGILVPVGDEERLATELSSLMEDEEKRELIGKNALGIREKLEPGKVFELWREYIEGRIGSGRTV